MIMFPVRILSSDDPTLDTDRLRESFAGLAPGNFVMFLGCTKEQLSYGGHSDPNGLLEVEGIYKVTRLELYASQSNLWVEGVDCEYGFNTVCFEPYTRR